MSGESRQHLERSAQRRFRRILIAVFAVIILVGAPLVISGELRLNLATRFGLAPGHDIEQIAGPDDDITLIVIPITAANETGREEYRFRASFLAHTGPDGVELTFIDDGRKLLLPLSDYDFYANSFDGRYVLFQDTRNPSAVHGVLVDTDTGDLTQMPADQPYPQHIPGDWQAGSWEHSMGHCGGISPHAKFISCFRNPALSSFIAGDWELQVRVYGAAKRVIPIFRGLGFRPWAGWSNDDARLYFQNENGIWMAPISLDQFP